MSSDKSDEMPFRGAIPITRLPVLSASARTSVDLGTLLVQEEFNARVQSTLKQDGPTAMASIFGHCDLSIQWNIVIKSPWNFTNYAFISYLVLSVTEKQRKTKTCDQKCPYYTHHAVLTVLFLSSYLQIR